MNEQRKELQTQIDRMISPKPYFTEKDKQHIRNSVRNIEKGKVAKRRYLWPKIVVFSAVCTFLVLVGGLIGKELGFFATGSQPATESDFTLFTLTDEEQTTYNNFSRSLDPIDLIDLEPLSVAKLYVYAGYKEEYSVQYALYTDRKEYIQWSAEEDKDLNVSHRGTKEQISSAYKNLDQGVFIKTSEYEGYITFYPNGNSGSPEDMSGFQMIQNEDGVWQVHFMPMQ